MSLTTDPNDSCLKRGVNEEKVPQNECYLIMSDEELAKGYVRPVREAYIHDVCGATTTMSLRIAETYAADPKFYGATYCIHCQKHLPVAEFKWLDGTVVGS